MQIMRKNRFLKYPLIMAVVLAGGVFALTATAMAVGDTTAPVVTSVIPADGSTIYTNGSSSVYYQYGNSTPLQIRAAYNDEEGGSGVDVASVMVHLDIANMLFDCPTQTATNVACNATAADLFPGPHPIDIYVDDLAGNPTVHRTWVTVAVDDAAPTYANLSPAGGTTIYTSQLNSAGINDMSALRFDYDIGDPAPSSGVVPMSHVNESVPPSVSGAMISNTSCVKTYSADGTTVTHYSCQVNRAKLLHLGDNTLSILLKDRVGNLSSDYSDDTGLNHYTVVDDVDPVVSGVTADPTAISATFADPLPTNALSPNLASGINSASAMVHVDGVMIMEGCTANATGVSCPTPAGLDPGTYPVEVFVSDNAGNTGSATGSLTIDPPPCTPGRPSLSLSHLAYWASYSDYQAKDLSVRLTVTNNGADTAYNVSIDSATPTNPAWTTVVGPPAALGNITGSSGTASAMLKFNVASSAGSRLNVTGSAEDGCGTTYTYP